MLDPAASEIIHAQLNCNDRSIASAHSWFGKMVELSILQEDLRRPHLHHHPNLAEVELPTTTAVVAWGDTLQEGVGVQAAETMKAVGGISASFSHSVAKYKWYNNLGLLLTKEAEGRAI